MGMSCPNCGNDINIDEYCNMVNGMYCCSQECVETYRFKILHGLLCGIYRFFSIKVDF